jgi:hypothetical protein
MPLSFRIDPAHRMVRTHGTGSLDLSDFANYFKAVTRHPDYRRDMDRLLDLSAATVEMSPGQMWQMLEMVKQAGFGAARVAVVAGDEQTLELARIYAMIAVSSESQVEVFPTVEAGEAWLRARRQTGADRIDRKA